MPTTPDKSVAQSTEQRRKNADIPNWLPAALLTVTTVAFVVPIVVLRRQRANALANSAPPRRAGVATTYTNRPTPKTASLNTPVTLNTRPTPKDDNFNGALYSAKAFGIATFLVTLGAFGGIWGVRTYLDVQNTEEFSTRMRAMVMNKIPVLSSRIHQRANEEGSTEEGAVVDWDWTEAQGRLTEAFEKDGLSGWAETALKEVEAEAQMERARRARPGESSER